MSATLDKILEEVRQLPPQEQRQLLNQLNEIIPSPATEDELEDEFERALAAEGFIAATTPLKMDEEEIKKFRDYQPITVEGQPLSEMIIEERR